MKRPSVFFILGLALAAAAYAAGPPSPESALGFRLGEDRRLADWIQILGYFRVLDEASPRVQVEEVGRTTEDRPFLVVTITSEANMARLEEIRRDNLRLADPRGLSEDEARQLLERGRAIVSLNHAIHSNEVAATQTAMETAYWLATSDEPDVREILDRTVVLMLPSHNPDGTQKVTEWYRGTLGTPWEGGRLPFLYHHYVGHDNNRDWYMFTQAETRLTVSHVYERWRPQIVHDLHQMGMRTARIFAPPYIDPWEPNVDPALRAASNALGSHVASRLTAEGKSGAVVRAIYDAWSPSRAYPHTHGGVRILTECASARLATPVEVAFKDLRPGVGYDPREASWNFPLPWPGGVWRLRDIMDYQLSATRAILEHAARNRDFWLRNFLGVNRRAAARRQPYAFVVPSHQADPLAAARLLHVLRTGGVEVHRAPAPFEAAGRKLAAGSHVVLMAQPTSGFAKSLLERQDYPDLRQYRGGPPLPPYDVTAHTLPLLMGVEVLTVPESFTAALDLVDEPAVAPGRVERGRGRWLAFGHKNGDLVALARLVQAGVPVRWATEAFVDRGRPFPAGTLMVAESVRSRMEPLARELGLDVRVVGTSPPVLLVGKPRVGLYRSYVASMDEGWTRFVFERHAALDYHTLVDRDVRAGGLRSRFDVIVLPDQSPQEILNGHPPQSLPPEYTGGIGAEGVKSLKAFVEEGGTLVTLDSASLLAVGELGLPVANALARFAGAAAEDEEEGPAAHAEFYAPGSILRARVEWQSPLTHGLDPFFPLWFEESPAFEVKGGRVLARYADEELLLSGWLLGGQHLRGKAALVEVPLGSGRVVLFGFRPQYRAQSWATYIPFLNAIYTSAAVPVRR